MTENQRRLAGRAGLVTLAILGAHLGTACRAEVTLWTEPAIDSWLYSNGGPGGVRGLTPSFGGAATIDPETQQFEPLGQGGPARLGSMVIAFETTDQVTPGLDPSRYAIASAKVTVRARDGHDGVLTYQDQPITPEGILAQALAGGVEPNQPMELFGVGFVEGFDGFALGPDQSGTRFSESTFGYQASYGGYVAYPAIGDGQGGYVDVSNNLTGGFSETAVGQTTAPFTATPWAIGKTDLQAGEAVPDNTTFDFDIDLDEPGVTAYLQESLSAGSLGFMLSSVQPAVQFGGSDGAPYPDWFAKEALGIYAGSEAATLTLDIVVLPLAGDYNDDGAVDQLDYATWEAAYGSSVAPLGSGADGNGDGVVDAADYTVWRDAWTATPSVAVPEPSSSLYALIGLATVAFCSGQYVYTAPRGTRE